MRGNPPDAFPLADVLPLASSSSLTTIPYLNVLSASASPAPDGGMLVKISAVKSNSNQSSSKLWALEGQVRSAPGEGKAREWVAVLERLAFGKGSSLLQRLRNSS